MFDTNSSQLCVCKHQLDSHHPGIAVIAIGNTLRGDDGVGMALMRSLRNKFSTDICCFDLGPYSSYVSKCLSGHDAAIVIDSTGNGTSPGTITVLDLAASLKFNRLTHLNSSHGASLADELRIAASTHKLPANLIFFGIEGGQTTDAAGLSEGLNQSMPDIADRFLQLLTLVQAKVARSAAPNKAVPEPFAEAV